MKPKSWFTTRSATKEPAAALRGMSTQPAVGAVGELKMAWWPTPQSADVWNTLPHKLRRSIT